MSRKVRDITVVGGGDAGLLAALALKQVNPNLHIEVVDDFEESPTNVGKSTYKAILNLLHDFLQIDEARFIDQAKPVWKASVFFRDWCGQDPFHYAFDVRSVKPAPDDPKSGEKLFYYYDTGDITTVGEQIVAEGRSPLIYSPREGGYAQYPAMAYHLDLDRFNGFLRTMCQERDIELVDDKIKSVTADGDWIHQVSSQNNEYGSDLFIDATGFKRLLMGELETDFRSFDIPLDTAFHAVAECSLSDVVPATVVESAEFGWFWQIDTIGSRDLGYVFASDYVNEADALDEFKDQRAEEFLEIETYHFDSGHLTEPWIGNCIAIGNSHGFIEPLESTALTTHLSSARFLSRLLAAHNRVNDRAIRDAYNLNTRGVWQSIYDFISVHYRFADGGNDFWKDMQQIPISRKVSQYIDYYDDMGLEVHDAEIVTEDGTELNMINFMTSSLYIIMRHMGAKSSFYENADISVSDAVKDAVRDEDKFRKNWAAECLTYEEVYRSGLVEKVTRDPQAFWDAGGMSRWSHLAEK